jgi:ribose/xylose/arabinose/galactoside ABC-type transport system permease subunit
VSGQAIPWRRVGRVVATYGIVAALVGLFVFLAISKPHTFFTEGNLKNVLRQNSFTAILAVGITLTILTRGIDLSVGSVVGLSGVLTVDLLAHGHGLASAVAAGLALGALVGVVNGLLVTRLKIPPFLASLAMMLVVRGAALKATDARPIEIPDGVRRGFLSISDGLFPVALMAAVLVVTWLVLVRTPFGRHVYAVGGNPEAARLSGIRVRRVLLLVYAACGLLAGLAGVMVASRVGAGDPNSGEGYELDAVAAAVVGGTSLFGGRGSVWGTLTGALFIGLLNNGLNLFEVQHYDQKIVKGLVLLAATSLDLWRGRDGVE